MRLKLKRQKKKKKLSEDAEGARGKRNGHSYIILDLLYCHCSSYPRLIHLLCVLVTLRRKIDLCRRRILPISFVGGGSAMLPLLGGL